MAATTLLSVPKHLAMTVPSREVHAVNLHHQLAVAKQYFAMILVKDQVVIPTISDVPKVLKTGVMENEMKNYEWKWKMNEKLKPHFFSTC